MKPEYEIISEYNEKDTMTTEEMYILDENSAGLGVSKHQLMENAGARVVEHLRRVISPRVPDGTDPTFVIFCGTGNNGGDGFVVARHLSGLGMRVAVILVGDPARIATPEARSNWDAICRMEMSVARVIVKDSSNLRLESVSRLLPFDINRPLVIVDALLGAGIRGKPREPVASAISLINSLSSEKGAIVVSVDTPSGLNPDTGEGEGYCVKASLTVTFHKKKEGLLGRPGITGDVVVAPIGIPPEAGLLVGRGDVVSLFKKGRDPNSFKGMNGKVLVVGGSNSYSGAPALSALAALHCGVDLVNVCAPSSVAGTIRGYSPDLIVTPLEGNVIAREHLPILQEKISWADTVLIGPGIGRAAETMDACREIIGLAISGGKNVVVDADGLKSLERHVELVDAPSVILTPHAGEFSVLSGVDASKLREFETRLRHALEFADDLACTLVLKGPVDIIATRSRCKLNTSGTPAMTVGGTGDVLAGICTAFASLFGVKLGTPFQVACAAAHVNGLLGERVEGELGGPFLTASMMVHRIGGLLGNFYRKS